MNKWKSLDYYRIQFVPKAKVKNPNLATQTAFNWNCNSVITIFKKKKKVNAYTAGLPTHEKWLHYQIARTPVILANVHKSQ